MNDQRANTARANGDRRSSRAWMALAGAVALAVLTVAVFAPVRHFDFVDLDDPQYVFENPNVTGGLTWSGVRWAITTPHASFWIPAVWISYMADIEIFGQGPAGHHVTNLLLHTAAALLLFLWLSRTTGALSRSWAVAALFALHPLRVESVAWITERKDVLSGLFWMIGLWAYASYVRRPTRRGFALLMAAFAFALASKPMVVMFPVVLLLLDIWPLGRLGTAPDAGRRMLVLVREKLPLVAMSLGVGVVTVVAHHRNQAVLGLNQISLPGRLLNALLSYFDYVRLTVWPSGLSAYYSLPASVPPWRVWTAVLVLTGLTAVVLAAARRRPFLAVGWGWFLITLLPVSGMVQAGVQARADRFTYLPSIGLYLMAAWGLAELAPRWRWRTAALIASTTLAVVACALATRSQLWHWKDTMALWTRASMVELQIDEYTSHMQSGSVLLSKERFAEARAHFEAAAGLKPGSADPHVSLALAYSAEGLPRAAIAAYQNALRLSPDLPIVHNDLGALLEKSGRLEEAIGHFREASRLAPDFAVAHANLALALVKLDRYPEAITEFQAVLRLDPGNALARRALDALVRRQPPD